MEKVNHNDIVKYVYKEVSKKEKARIEEALFGNQLLEDEFYSMVDLKKQLDGLNGAFEPRKGVLNKILNFSKSFNTEVENR